MKKGFISTTLVYTLLIIFLFLIVSILVIYTRQNSFLDVINDRIKNEVVIGKKNKWYEDISSHPNYLTTKMLTAEMPYADTDINFAAISGPTNGQGLYYTTDENDTQDGSRVYYYRGDVDNNHVIFANLCWRIVRTNEDGSIRMRYNGTPDSNGACPVKGTAVYASYVKIGNTYSGEDIKYNDVASSLLDNRHVGYMYGNDCNSYETCHANEVSSTIKEFIDEWYYYAIGRDAFYGNKVVASNFCNDRSLLSNDDLGLIGINNSNGNGVSKNTTFYNGRLTRDPYGTPTYKCSRSSDILRLNAGLLTLDEARFAGGRGGGGSPANTSYYLYTSTKYWTMTPSNYDGSTALVNYVSSNGATYAESIIETTLGKHSVLPVISLKADVEVFVGNGDRTSPWEISKRLYVKMLENSTPYADTNINFAEASSETNGEGLYYTTDPNSTQDGSKVYYYRGNINNNHVIFAGFCWRIIRTNEDGSIRMRYNGTPGANGTCPQKGESVYPFYVKNGNIINGDSVKFNNYDYDNRHVGYMHGSVCTSYESCHANEINSTAKVFVDEWYQYTIGANPIYNSKVAISDFCVDRSLASNYNFEEIWQFYTTNGPGYGHEETFYGANDRFYSEALKPTYKCPQENDILKLKVGMLTTDEVMFAGVEKHQGKVDNYLFTNSLYWLISPGQFNGLSKPFTLISGWLTDAFASAAWNSMPVLPVISLKSYVKVTDGTGSDTDPWVINDNEANMNETPWYENTSSHPNYLTTKMLTSETPYADNVSSPNAPDPTGINFAAISGSTNGQGLYYTTNTNLTQDGSRVYYYRGVTENNHVIFAGFCWRIVRTNEDGSVRLRYNGVPYHDELCSTIDNIKNYNANVSVGSSKFNNANNSNKYVGYMYGTTCTSYETCHGNENNSVIKKFVDSWYQTNIGNNLDYDSKVVMTNFCNDRSLSTGTGINQETTKYTPLNRRGGGVPTYKCSQPNDILRLKVGLLTLDDVRFAGGRGGGGSPANTSYYLYANKRYWTMTPSEYNKEGDLTAYVNYVHTTGETYAEPSTQEFAVFPVISLKADVQVSIGEGSSFNPWRVD